MMLKLFFPFLLVAFSLHADSVYCLHGFLRSSKSMEKMGHAFRQEGMIVYNWGYPSREKTIEEHAEDLVRNLRETASRHPGEAIHFATHSLGGIIVRAAHNHPDFPEEAKQGKAVLLAPPNQGSRFGRFLKYTPPISQMLGKKAGRELLTNQNFNHIGEFPEEKDVLVISGTYGWNPLAKGKNDGKVGVYECCLNTPHEHRTHFAGHSWIMKSDTVIEYSVDFITK